MISKYISWLEVVSVLYDLATNGISKMYYLNTRKIFEHN